MYCEAVRQRTVSNVYFGVITHCSMYDTAKLLGEKSLRRVPEVHERCLIYCAAEMFNKKHSVTWSVRAV